MAQIIASIDLTGLAITGIQTVTIQTADTLGTNYTLCTLTQDFTGITITQFLNDLVACVNSGGSGFVASNQNPFLEITYTGDITLLVGQQVNITYFDGVRDLHLGNASFLEVVAAVTGCDACFPTDLIACYGSYAIDIGLDADTTYNLIFTDKHGNKYSYAVTTGSDGSFTIVPTNFPEGFFTPEFGIVTAVILDANNVPVTFTIGYSIYDCLSFNVDYLTIIA